MREIADDFDALAAIVDALYRTAANPEAWDALVDVLPLEADLAAAGAGVQSDLQRILGIAADVQARQPALRAEPASVELSSRLAITALNAGAYGVFHPAGVSVGAVLPMADEATAESVARAIAALRMGEESAALLLALPGGVGPAIATLRANADGYSLTFVPPQAEIPGLGRLGLSPAESRLANALRRSAGLKEAAAALGISAHTARNQLASIFAKLGVNRQGDLIRILTELGAMTPPRDRAALGADRRSITLPDGRRLAYRLYGLATGAAVLAFHEGLGSSLLPPSTDALARRLGLCIVAADRPGFGGSDPLSDHSFAAVAADMEALCGALDIQRPAIMALLAGAAPALATAERMGPRITKVVLLSGRSPRPTPAADATPLTAFRARLERHAWLRPTIFRLLKTRVSAALIGRMLRRAARNSPGDLDYLNRNPDLPAFVSAYVAEALEGDGVGPSAELAANQADTGIRLENIEAPLFLFHGAEDQLSPLEPLRRYLGQHPYELTLLGDIGQFMTLKHWEEILGTLR